MLSRKIVINNPSGLHMRPAGIFVKTLSPFKSHVGFEIRGNTYNAKSMINVLAAAVKCGDEIELIINGIDEQDCMDAVVAEIKNGLGEGGGGDAGGSDAGGGVTGGSVTGGGVTGGSVTGGRGGDTGGGVTGGSVTGGRGGDIGGGGGDSASKREGQLCA